MDYIKIISYTTYVKSGLWCDEYFGLQWARQLSWQRTPGSVTPRLKADKNDWRILETWGLQASSSTQVVAPSKTKVMYLVLLFIL